MISALDSFIKRRRAQKFLEELENLIAVTTVQWFQGPLSGLIDQENRRQLQQNYVQRYINSAHEILNSENPALETRSAVADHVFYQASFLVLLVPVEGLKVPWLWLDGVPYVSGQLKQYDREIVKKDQYLTNQFEHLEEFSDIDLRQALYLYSFLRQLGATVFSEMLLKVEKNPSLSWVTPLLKITAIAREHEYRKVVGLPSVLPESGLVDLDVLVAHKLEELVRKGDKHPFKTWKKMARDLENETNGRINWWNSIDF